MNETQLFELKFNSLDISQYMIMMAIIYVKWTAKSKMLFDLLTSNKILEISEKYLGEKFELKCHRVYSVGSGSKKSMAY